MSAIPKLGKGLPVKCVAVVAGVVSIALSPQRPAFRAGVDTVEVYATVSDRAGRLVPNLPREEFQLLSDGKPVELTVFSNEIKTITVVVLIDTSGSTVERLLWFRQSVGHLVDALQGNDRLRIGSFGEEIAISPHLTGDKAILKRILRDELWPGGGTPLWRAMHEGIRSLAAEDGRRVVLVMSDGVNIGSRMLENDVRRRAVEGGFMVYALSAQGMGLGLLRDVAEATGGGYLEVRADADLNETMTRVAEELRHQYMLGFTPPVIDGKPHRLTVRLTTSGLRARAPREYVPQPKRP